ncbi:hypothetical protein CCYN74_100089 [Capnocytophaga cynodegmi]|uniref:Uncharacterized protein n=1 Tax=Capnocytophaga cynodegmi TaxID=28189 RepID=A0A0B7H9G1_9FLAO|nr:hypothetical protein CCYN74_100089 [Capnocytophaga cynodegmi]
MLVFELYVLFLPTKPDIYHIFSFFLESNQNVKHNDSSI